MKVTIRQKVEAVCDAGISTRYMELLLLQSHMTRRDLEYVQKLYDIVQRARTDDVID